MHKPKDNNWIRDNHSKYFLTFIPVHIGYNNWSNIIGSLSIKLLMSPTFLRQNTYDELII